MFFLKYGGQMWRQKYKTRASATTSETKNGPLADQEIK
jgi:hypothetical protein